MKRLVDYRGGVIDDLYIRHWVAIVQLYSQVIFVTLEYFLSNWEYSNALTSPSHEIYRLQVAMTKHLENFFVKALHVLQSCYLKWLNPLELLPLLQPLRNLAYQE